MTSVQSHRTLTIPELLQQPERWNRCAVRTLGRLVKRDIARDIATLEYQGASLNLNTKQIGDFPFKMGSMFQFIGEFEIDKEGELVLNVRVGRNVDGLDVKLYMDALDVMRKHLAIYPYGDQ